MMFEAQQREVRSIRGHYRTGHDDLGRDFFQPALSHCTLYQRAAGYFSSSAFVSWGRLLRRLPTALDVHVQLIISPELSEEDASVLRRVVSGSEDEVALEEVLERYVLDSLLSEAAFQDPESRGALLTWLLKTRRLELRFGIPANSRAGLYHEKIGLLHYPWGDCLAFTGSANETYSGHALNLESIDVYRGWDARDAERVETKLQQFEEAWEGRTPGLHCVRLSAQSLDRIRVRVDSAGPAADGGTTPWGESSKLRSLRPFQEDAIRAWESAGRKGMLAMCTGAGKTVTAIAALVRLHAVRQAGRGLAAVVACPTKVLVEQWERAIRDWAPEAMILKAYESVHNYAENLPALLCPASETDFNVVLTTYDSLFSRALMSQLERASTQGHKVVFVADEAHHLASGNRLRDLKTLIPLSRATLGLTATPEIEDEPHATASLQESLGSIVYEYSLSRAIGEGVLCPYRYFPRPVFLDRQLSEEYVRLLLEEDSGDQGIVLRAFREKRDLLRRSGHYVAELDRLIREFRSRQEDLALTVVFSPPGRAEAHGPERIIAQIKSVFEKYHITCGTITAGTEASRRPEILEGFARCDYEVLLGIGCLDEGLDVPSTRRAIVLYSYDREKQFIQRRGRVLRRSEGKTMADIYDLILLPQGSSLPPARMEDLFRRETRRHRVFCEDALNKGEALDALDRAIQTVLEV